MVVYHFIKVLTLSRHVVGCSLADFRLLRMICLGYILFLLNSGYDRVYRQFLKVRKGLSHALVSIDIDWNDLVDKPMLILDRFLDLKSFIVAIRRVYGLRIGRMALETSCRLHHLFVKIYLLFEIQCWLLIFNNSKTDQIMTLSGRKNL